MSIFGIIVIALVIALIVLLAGLFISCNTYRETLGYGISIVLSVLVFISGIFIGIGLNTEDAKIWSAKYEAQKTTIEQSLESDVLSGLERIELVNKAAELNGELAERKASSELWHFVYYSDNVYEGLEPICIK